MHGLGEGCDCTHPHQGCRSQGPLGTPAARESVGSPPPCAPSPGVRWKQTGDRWRRAALSTEDCEGWPQRRPQRGRQSGEGCGGAHAPGCPSSRAGSPKQGAPPLQSRPPHSAPGRAPPALAERRRCRAPPPGTAPGPAGEEGRGGLCVCVCFVEKRRGDEQRGARKGQRQKSVVAAGRACERSSWVATALKGRVTVGGKGKG